MTKIKLDAKYEARHIISTVTDNMIRSTNYEPANNDELYECMTEECANILTEDFLDGKYTPMEYNAIRNELAKVLWNIFEPHIQREHETNE